MQSPAQLYERWGKYAGETIWSNTNIHVVLGGLKAGEVNYLEALSKLCGERDERTVTKSRDDEGKRSRSYSVRRAPVMSPDKIRTLPQWQALVLHRNTRPVLAKLTPVWKRHDLTASPAAQPAPVSEPEPMAVAVAVAD